MQSALWESLLSRCGKDTNRITCIASINRKCDLGETNEEQGLLGFTAEVLFSNQPMRSLFEKMGFDIEKRREEGVYELKMRFREV